MDTFHGAIADTGYYMHEGVPSDAAFLTPIALLTGGQAFKDALKVASGVASTTPQYEKRVDVAKISVYFVVLLRWCAMPFVVDIGYPRPGPIASASTSDLLRHFLAIILWLRMRVW